MKVVINLKSVEKYKLDITNEIIKSFSIDDYIDVDILDRLREIFNRDGKDVNINGIVNIYDKLINDFDGTGRKVREIQREAFKIVSEKIDECDIIFLQMGVGSGKSAVLKAVQDLYGNAVYMTGQNVLLEQLQKTYNSLPILKGKKRYICKESVEELNCEEASKILSAGKGNKNGPIYCKKCPYFQARCEALNGNPVGVNLMSFFYLQYDKDFLPPRILLIDEAHTIIAALKQLASKVFSQDDYDFDEKELTSDRKIVKWMEELVDKLVTVKEAYVQCAIEEEISNIEEHINQIKMIIEMIIEAPQNYVFSFKEDAKGVKKFIVQPIRIPNGLLTKILNAHKIIFTSGTLLKHHVDELANGVDKYHYSDLGMPIPKENRIIKFYPLAVKANVNTDANDYCDLILKIIRGVARKDIIEYGKGKISADRINYVIHVTYSLQNKLYGILKSQLGPFLHVNTSENKNEVVSNFIKEGGIFLAAGCSEGLDFDYDKCRVQIIPKLPFPNKTDELIMKRMSFSDGNLWYVLETFTTLIQMTGRSTRAVDDFSITYILDPLFPKMINDYRNYLPKSFIESIKWR